MKLENILEFRQGSEDIMDENREETGWTIQNLQTPADLEDLKDKLVNEVGSPWNHMTTKTRKGKRLTSRGETGSYKSLLH